MRKIVFHLNCLGQGGAERVVCNLANQLSQDEYEVVVATEWQEEDEYPLDSKVRRVHVGILPQDEIRSRIKKALLRVKYLRTFLKGEKPELVISFAHKANYRALLATIGLKAPVIISVRNDPLRYYNSFADKILIALLYPRAAGCVFQTEKQREFFPKYLQKKSRIILNPINQKYIGREKPAQRTKRVVHSGRLVDFKNQPMLIRAFLKVHEEHPDYVLEIYGNDALDGTKEILERLIEDHHARSYVRLMGRSNSLEKDMEDASVYAFSSDWEGLPNALMEAMALGLPVVATDCPCGGPGTIIKDGENGLLVPVGDDDALAQGICRLIEERDLAERLGENAKKIGQEANSVTIMEQWKEYMEGVLANVRI